MARTKMTSGNPKSPHVLTRIGDNEFTYRGHTIVLSKIPGKKSGWRAEVSGEDVPRWTLDGQGTRTAFAKDVALVIDLQAWHGSEMAQKATVRQRGDVLSEGQWDEIILDEELTQGNPMARRRKNPMGRKFSADEWVEFWLEGAAESNELDRSSVEITPKLAKAVRRYEDRLVEVLGPWVRKHPTKTGGDFDDQLDAVWTADAPHKVFATLRGEGIGIWDGDWDHLYNDSDLKALQKHLEKQLADVADVTGGGWLNDAFNNAALETGSPRRRNPAASKRPASRSNNPAGTRVRRLATRMARGG